MWRFLCLVSCLLVGCSPPFSSLYYWKTTLNWTAADTEKLVTSRVDRVGLRLFDWGDRGVEGPLVVQSPIPAGFEVVPVVYVTTRRLEAWAAQRALDAEAEADRLLARMDAVLAPAWAGRPEVWQLDADWSAGTREAWFAIVAAFRERVHARGGRLEVTVRLHQYRDRLAQGVPPADGGVLMLYGAGDAVLDPDLVKAYLVGPPYPLPLVAAFPTYTQVRQLNGYGRLVALHRLSAGQELPVADLRPVDAETFEVIRRTTFGGRALMAKDTLKVDRVSHETLVRTAALPGVEVLRRAAGGRVWFFDYDPNGDIAPALE